MKIIDNKKDYYDYLSGIYGIDDLIVFDRRGSITLRPDSYTSENMGECFSLLKLSCDKPLMPKRRWNLESFGKRVAASGNKKYNYTKTWLEGTVYHYILEIGWNQYCFEVERWTVPEKPHDVCVDYRLIETRIDAKKRFSEVPICIIPCHVSFGWLGEDATWKEYNTMLCKRINNPILCHTYIPKVIPATDVWNAVYNYLSSQKEKPFVDSRNDVQKLEAAGFDKKTSFRK